MLSGETAAGKYPVQAVRTMAKIAETTEELSLQKKDHIVITGGDTTGFSGNTNLIKIEEI